MLFVVGGLQPVVLAVIVMWGVEDAAAKGALGRSAQFVVDEGEE